MNYRLVYLIFSTLASFLLLFRCAVQTPPSGGPKDEDPPVLLNSFPANKETNFQETTIVLTFNEWVQANDFNNQLLITPTYRGEYKTDFRKNIVTLEFDTLFDENTTYTLNFRDAIRDITEGNVPEELRIAFSTGDKLDSLGVSGRVKMHLKDLAAEKYTVALYDLKDSLNVTEDVPKYFTKTNTSGRYRFENIKDGQYAIYAFGDLNNDLILQTSSEPYGFLSETILLDSVTRNINLSTVSLNLDTLEISSARQNGFVFEVKFNKNVDSVAVDPLDSTFNYPVYYDQPEANSLKIYYSFPKEDTTFLQVFASDSAAFTITDTVAVSFAETRRTMDPIKLQNASGTIYEDSLWLRLNLTTNKPISSFNPDSLSFFYNDTVSLSSEIDTTKFFYNVSKNLIELSRLLPDTLFYNKDTVSGQFITGEDKRIQTPLNVKFYQGAVISVDRDTLETVEINTKYIRQSQFGLIEGSVSSDYKFTVQLTNSNYQVLESYDNLKNFVFRDLKPANYFVRILVDLNNNGKWDPGNIFLNEQPEPIVYYEEADRSREIILKANWERTEIDISYPPVDKSEDNVGN